MLGRYGAGRMVPCFRSYHTAMDTAELLKAAMDAVKAAGVPKELQAAALELAVADLRAGSGSSKRSGNAKAKGTSAGTTRTPAKRSASRRKTADPAPEDAVLAGLPDEAAFFRAIEKETGVSQQDLGDIFHIEAGRLELKVPSRSLGANKRAQTQTVAALLAGAVFAGTSERRLSFGEINVVCNANHCFDSANSASSIRSTPGFSSVGTGKAQVLVTRSGWQEEFAAAAMRVLGKPE